MQATIPKVSLVFKDLATAPLLLAISHPVPVFFPLFLSARGNSGREGTTGRVDYRAFILSGTGLLKY